MWQKLGAVAIVGVIMTAGAYKYAEIQELSDARAGLENRTQAVEAAIQQRVSRYESAVTSGRAYYAHGNEDTREGWFRYVESLDIEEYYPGMYGLVSILEVPYRDLEGFEQRLNSEHPEGFVVRPLPSSNESACVIQYAEPESRNLGSIGFNVCSSDSVRDVLFSARESGQVMATVRGDIRDDAEGSGALIVFYAPRYQSGIPGSREARRRAGNGWIGAPVFMAEMMSGLVSDNLILRISDEQARSTLFSVGSPRDAEVRSRTETTIGGRTWRIDTGSPVQMSMAPMAIGLGGLVTTFLLCMVLYRTMRTKDKAEKLAREMTSDLRNQKEFTESVLHNSTEGMFRMTPKGELTWCNPEIARMFGYRNPKEMVQQKNPIVWVDPPQIGALIQRLEKSGHYKDEEMRVQDRHGREFWVMSSARAVDRNGKVAAFDGSLIDITDRKEQERQQFRLAHYDSLTQLPNRQLLMATIDRQLAIAKRRQIPFALMFLDLDGFKAVNDTLGHAAGDKLLRDVSERLTEVMRDEDMVAREGLFGEADNQGVSRQGGDEFVVLLPELRSRGGKADVRNICERIISRLEEPYDLEGEAITSVSTSIGVALYPQDGQTRDDLMKNADIAMYAAKGAGKATYVFFETTSAGDRAAAISS